MPYVRPDPTQRWRVADDLDWCQLFLHDQGALFARDELLDWYQDAYRQLLARTHATRQWRGLDVPPRYTRTYTHPWEQAFTERGTSQPIGYRGHSGSTYTYAWEVEHAEGLPVTDGAAVCCTQLWEYAYLPDGGTTDQYFTFAVPRQHERPARVYWDEKPLAAQSVRELDALDACWWREGSEPWLWTKGTGGTRHFDCYQLRTDYQQGYDLMYNETANTGGESGVPLGVVREPTGARTYTAVSDDGTVPYGVLRGVMSPERQYLGQPTWSPALGTIREWRSTSASVFVWEVVVPDHPLLAEVDTPLMVPAQLQKYLRFAVLWRAFSRQGEGQRLDLAALYEQRWQRGIALFKRLGWLTRRDRELQRQPREARGRAVPRPRLPSTFPRSLGV